MRFIKGNKNAEDQNLLDMVPLLKEGLTIEQGNDFVIVFMPRQSWIERQAVRFLNQPAIIKVKLDDLGAAVATRCDGQHSISDIAMSLQVEFGEAAEPLIPRLVKFVELMEVNQWIEWKPIMD
ncbi:PqqD family peptide modification chaperone [Paenibacillus sp. EC2-1]|uniref:PqqD family peptide modification chaperone n=1 Tax=Paenibacillus sp. EC2-1 TaxID=3388665 RepID=UPI003BEF2130